MEMFDEFFLSGKKFLRFSLIREKFGEEIYPISIAFRNNFRVKLMRYARSWKFVAKKTGSNAFLRFLPTGLSPFIFFEEKTYVFLPKYLNIIHYVNCNYI